MAEGDFEVMPRGTAKELRRLRQFASEMLAFREKYVFPKEVTDCIEDVKDFYSWEVEE